ncbi:hypothetical protein AUJ83_00695 [Candidatus Woesearchaeota archaeon CG1_02_33_12]|nr:MAG: hypothetical protein AUJ83_00695 [Candidatus Woesearchaeota archaeon CG1_02_33_12]PIU02524.1 MAG: hypothetical protein COT55_03075 [Candidatus Diapherotrites archaeon CG09_land_8_20_14_0_10_32_12]
MNSKYFIIIIIFFINLIGMISIIFGIGPFFISELLLLFLFLVSAVIIVYNIYHNREEAWIISLLFFAAYLINITFLYFYSQNQALFVLLILTTIIGFIISIENIKGKIKAKSAYEKEILREAEELTKAEKYFEEKTPDIVVEEVKPSEHFTETRVKKPEKKKTAIKSLKGYVASRKGINYHDPKCRWARKILPKRKVWFKDRKEAEEEGLKPCKCIK